MDWSAVLDKHLGAVEAAVSSKAPEAWGIMVHGAFVSGLTGAVACAMSVAIVAALWVVVLMAWRRVEWDTEKSSAALDVGTLVLAVCSFAATVATLTHGIQSLNALLAPDYAALTQILQAVK